MSNQIITRSHQSFHHEIMMTDSFEIDYFDG